MKKACGNRDNSMMTEFLLFPHEWWMMNDKGVEKGTGNYECYEIEAPVL